MSLLFSLLSLVFSAHLGPPPCCAWHNSPVSSTLFSLTFIIPWAKLLCALISCQIHCSERQENVDSLTSASLTQKGQAVERGKLLGRNCKVLEVFGRESILPVSR